MTTFEVVGPDPDGDWYIERIEQRSAVTNRYVLSEAYPTKEKAQAAADAFNADPENAPTA